MWVSYQSWGGDIAIDANGDIMVAGSLDNGLGNYHSDFFVTKIDHELGEPLWEHTVPSIAGGRAEQIATVGGDAIVAAGTIANRTTDCGADTDLVAVKLRGETGELFSPTISPTPRPSGRCTDHMLYVTSWSEPPDGESPARGRLAFIDGLTLNPLASIEVGERPTQVVIDPKRPIAYVVDPGDRWWAEGADAGRVFEIDIPRREIIAQVEVGSGAGSIAITDDAEKLYVSNLGSASVTVLATRPLRVVGTIAGFDWDAPVTFDRDRVRDLFSLGFVERHQDVIFLGPVGVGKTFLACALGHAACRAGNDVCFLRADHLLQRLHQSRADHSTEKVLRSLLAPDVLIIDDFGLRRLDPQQSSDLYEVILERHRRASTILTSNRTIDEWIPLFDDPILAQSAVDRLAHNAYQVVIEGDSYRKRQRPGMSDSVPAPPRQPRRRRGAIN